MEYRIKEHKKDGKIKYQIQVKRGWFWFNYIVEKEFFGEYYIQDFRYESLESAQEQLRYFKDVSNEVVIYHY